MRIILGLAMAAAVSVAGGEVVAQAWQPVQGRLMTEWGEQLTPDNAWPVYPRPQMVREGWRNLNGLWHYHVSPDQPSDAIPQAWDGTILVPFPIESSLSGVGRMLQPDEALWYQRQVHVDKRPDKQYLLHFEAVDYACDVRVNGAKVGGHVGGHVPFAFNITRFLSDGTNRITLKVIDRTGNHQPRGKQVRRPQGIYYTQVSGVWQTVWLEAVPDAYIDALRIVTSIDPATIHVAADVKGDAPPGQSIHVSVVDGSRAVAEGQGRASCAITVPQAKLWSPDTPHLYELRIELRDRDKRVVDSVTSYAGIRVFGRKADGHGDLRFTLNGEFLFHLGTLDQGWWPDGLLTPPSDEAMRYDVQWLKEAGFNTIRKHVKVEPRRYYYHCDRLGMIVWQDMPNAHEGSPEWKHLSGGPEADWPDEARDRFMFELKRMIDTLRNNPSVAVWVPFNERWGQHDTVKVGEWVGAYDPTRLVNIASGGNFFDVGDIADRHSYPDPRFPTDDERFGKYVKVAGEFGGHGFVVDKKHLWDAEARNWGYGGLPKTREQLVDRYAGTLHRLAQLKDRGVAAGIYTQTTDVEGEVNGLLTYDRRVVKIPAAQLATMNQRLTEHKANAATGASDDVSGNTGAGR